MSRSASQASSAPSTATTLSRMLSMKTPNANTRSAYSNPLAPSNVKLLVTNLRLLDLDLKEDWPGITVQTFSTRHAEQNQKKRIECVEWALFRLFEIWDPQETTEKLQAFFPPLEPLQSRNLRNALHRCLDGLKKNGALGKEAVLRKSMLDDCKDNKLYDLMVLFSTAVLKKMISEKGELEGDTAVARKLAMASKLASDQQSSLLPLAIAHKAALMNLLRKKDEARQRYMQFSLLLDKKRDHITQRSQQCQKMRSSRKSMVSEGDTAAIKKQLQNNWIGNTKWLDTMLHGDDEQAEDSFLTCSFERVWRVVEKGGRLEAAGQQPGLLENLERRVEEQKTRLQKWKSFHEEMVKNKPDVARQFCGAEKNTKVTANFRFDDHLKLQLGFTKTNGGSMSEEKRLVNPEYQDIVSEMDHGLQQVAHANHNRSTIPLMRRRASSFNKARSPVRSRLSRRDSAPRKPVVSVDHHATEKAVNRLPPARQLSTEHIPILPRPAAPVKYDTAEKATKYVSPVRQLSKEKVPALVKHQLQATPVDSEATLIGLPTSTRSAPSPPPEVHVDEKRHRPRHVPETVPSPTPVPPAIAFPILHRSPSPSPSNLPSEPSVLPSEPPISPEDSPTPTLESPTPVFELPVPALSYEDQLAEQIIGSIDTATPSPIKRQSRLSLADRTRMSMAHLSSFSPIVESPPDSNPLPELPSQPALAPLDGRATLLERTRVSMAAMSSRPRDPERRKSRSSRSRHRESLFPVNQFETPRSAKVIKSLEVSRERSRDTTPKEELFSDDVDYEKVFKSRPKIALSPVFSPRDEEEEAKEEEEEEEEEEEGGQGEFDEGVTGVDLGDLDTDSDGGVGGWRDSPSRRVGKGRVFG
ncbi:hypothetical protein GQ43DRAFT_476641 [Delitschia confertaspora ATCC 74209]|uniref:HAUS augmin-like complex subunit 6 N-terminal domain-containing protein n=1 Tax=Delitschia confertaspora ATCC 74209 TaxID=1513339 RepID=A0A9P4JD34_9PLEO|nr:hypothetical protein GQ43DRAFT_476641 [Delitschia confertaspora ATCC 74209]